MNINIGKQNGFTLVEMLVAVTIFAILIIGVSAMLRDIFVNSNQELASLSNIDQARAAMFTFTSEIRDATTGSDGSYPLNRAEDSQIIFYSNFGSANALVKRIRYYVADGNLYKGVVIPTGNPLDYNLNSEKITTVAEGIFNGDTPVFSYYNGDFNGATDKLGQPVNINNVRFVEINLLIAKKNTPEDTNTFSISAGAAIRSIKDNLGN